MLRELRTRKPLIHCITNHVVSNFQANGLLALGVSPVMGDEQQEVAELTGHADALSLNIGTITERSFESMLIAGRAAMEKGIPIVLDPVGAGATAYRLQAVKRLLTELDVTLLRCNAGELAAIAGADWQARGVDAGEGQGDLGMIAKQVADEYQTIVAVTGTSDLVTDGERTEHITGGDPLMASVTGMGCLLSAVLAAFLTDKESTPLDVLAYGLQIYGNAGSRASKVALNPGTFQMAFLDELSKRQEAALYGR
ncbi:hydroxyethylthiazole kinase [Planococcus sp. CP5-4]|uniref:hydroxyethylthiazole kinase n=1 Tax=unclassified Planococcus (in: firmicutes) TaxID=2662419 RepID=UPI001C21D1BD|nr:MULTISPECIES: hydroxyethylthiazole kinase [unclassified Planococcus (in: firmicutes)]MBU9673409.1 hydroxyethylthiazole kinase [Planococcus sp. CP5-4_YE]MBV0908182.1 hydroxyethylthiazole kinase [Planococcus sp. CP5-4_UN]MBW6062243.1 hydroxyethylthiazole kinase [Planococcus sp. CP5-4]